MNQPAAIGDAQPTTTVAKVIGLSRHDLEAKFHLLAMSPPPAKLEAGVTYYAIPTLPERIGYNCQKCHEKTFYSRKADGNWELLFELGAVDTYRRLAKQIRGQGLNVVLDESSFCQNCGKDANAKAFVLETRWPGQKKPYRVALLDTEDFLLVLEFLEGKSKHVGPQGRETSLRSHLPRLRELIGITNAGKKPEERKP